MKLGSWWAHGVAGIVLGVGLGWPSGGCTSEQAFACGADAQCGDGTCLEGYCAFPDSECDSGQRYGALAGSLSGTCAPAPGGTDSTATGSGTTSAGTQGTTSVGSTDPTLTGGATSTSTTDAATSMVDPSDGTGTTDPTTSAGGSTGGSPTSGGTTGPVPIERVDEGLVAYYRPDDIDSGTTVPDISGVDPALDMMLQGGGFSWVDGGLQTTGEGIVIASGSAAKIRNACQASDELTVEVWVTPDNGTQFGPARIVTYSQDTLERNFTLGQGNFDGAAGWAGRARTTVTNASGVPEVFYDGSVATELSHVVFTRSSGGTSTLFLDGLEIQQLAVGGDFSVWSDSASHQFAWGNEITLDRDWAGTFHLVAVYGRALSDQEVAQNFAAGL